MSHEPLGSASYAFRGSHLSWPVNKEGYAIVIASKRLEYSMWTGVNIYNIHETLAYILDCQVCASVTKAPTQRFAELRTFLGQYPIKIVHGTGEGSCPGDILSRWRTLVPDAQKSPGPLRRTTVFAMAEADYSLPTKHVIKDRRVVVMSSNEVEKTIVGPSRRVPDGVCRVRFNSEPLLWIPPEHLPVCTPLLRELEMDNILDIAPLNDGSYSVLVEWQGLGSSSSEAVSKMNEDTTEFLKGKLKRTRLPAPVRKDLRNLCGLRL